MCLELILKSEHALILILDSFFGSFAYFSIKDVKSEIQGPLVVLQHPFGGLPRPLSVSMVPTSRSTFARGKLQNILSPEDA